ncbi:MAG: putative Ig domain-containing protein [bacterium]|nr:putative Ig domain-containing protein [bacterium]
MTFRAAACRLTVALLALLPCLPAAGATNKIVRVLLMAGQSNMGGTGNASDLLPDMINQTNVWFDNATPGGSATTNWTVLGAAAGFGPEVGCGFVVANALPNEQIAIVKDSAAATGIDFWCLAGSAGFVSLTDRIALVRARLTAQQLAGAIAGWHFAGFFWMQGENEADATATSPSLAYFNSMTDLVCKVRSVTGVTNLPVVLGRTHAGLTVNVPLHLLYVRSNQVRFAQYDPHADWVNIDDVGLQDGLHLNSPGSLKLGLRMGTAHLGLTEPNPCVNIEQAADQVDPTAERTVCFSLRASKPLVALTGADVALDGTAGPTTAAVWRTAAYNGTSEWYTVAVSGMTNGGNVRARLVPDRVASGVFSNFPSVSEDNIISVGIPRSTTNLLLHDDGNVPAGPLHKAAPGFGWRNEGWYEQNSKTQGYEITLAAPLSYSNLIVNAPHAKGGYAWETSGRAFDMLTALRAYHTEGDLANLGRSNDEYWVSFLARRDQNQTWNFALCRSDITWSDTARAVAVFQNNGNWALQLMGSPGMQVETSVAATVGQTYLMVLRLRFAGVLASNIVDLFINPLPLGGAPPTTPTATLTTTANNFKFARMIWYPGDSPNYGSLDEIRMGTTYAAVTPVVPTNTVPEILTTNLPPAVMGQSYGAVVRTVSGAGRLSWHVTDGSMPGGLELDALGVISGVPAAAGSNTFTVQVTDNAAQTATQTLALVVLPEPGMALVLCFAAVLLSSRD